MKVSLLQDYWTLPPETQRQIILAVKEQSCPECKGDGECRHGSEYCDEWDCDGKCHRCHGSGETLLTNDELLHAGVSKNFRSKLFGGTF